MADETASFIVSNECEAAALVWRQVELLNLAIEAAAQRGLVVEIKRAEDRYRVKIASLIEAPATPAYLVYSQISKVK